VRTLGWRVFLGTGLAGFLGTVSLARVVGQPVVDHFGATSLFATAVYAPFTEEVLKLLPVVLVLVLAARRREARPSVLDLVLLGAWSGTGFALYEDALYGRGGAKWGVAPPFSFFVPSAQKAVYGGSTFVSGGHLVFTAIAAMGLAFTVLYRRRYRWAWLAAPLAFALAYGEHVGLNMLATGGANGSVPLTEKILSPVTLGGRLSTLVLIAGVAALARVEWRAVARGPISTWFVLRPAESARRAQFLAAAQRPPAVQPVAAWQPALTGGQW
jgi:hypothetical protein